ncbi:uncharacterized protein C5orf52 homolog [Dendropsophus ebraccatus]|uniref:uncharacterized protein C5orf52 homolog n=1 Tax=Dendropsophus ebraccatus TaxID=150705 RepID=UPI003831CF75
MSSEASGGPTVTFFTKKCTEGPMLFSIISKAERGRLPRSHLADVIIQINISEKRKLELTLKQISRMRRKNLHFYEFLKKKFESDLHKKCAGWEEEHKSFMKSLHLEEKSGSTSPGRCPPPVLRKLYPTSSEVTGRERHHVRD